MYYSAIHSLLLYVSSANLIKIRSAYSNDWIKVSIFSKKQDYAIFKGIFLKGNDNRQVSFGRREVHW